MHEEILGKSVTLCDHCKLPLRKEDDVDGENLQAKFNNSKGEPKDYHYCGTECLRSWLNHKSKLLRKSKAEFNNGTWDIEYAPVEFTQSKLWT